MSQPTEFGFLLLFIVAGAAFVSITFAVNRLIRAHRPNEEKNTTYECGEDPMGNAWGRFNIRFYVVALIFVLFDVEIIFLFPWATVFGQKALMESTDGLWGWFSLAEMGIFIGILALGLAYAWAKGYLNWVKPTPTKHEYGTHIPKSLYDDVNKRYQ